MPFFEENRFSGFSQCVRRDKPIQDGRHLENRIHPTDLEILPEKGWGSNKKNRRGPSSMTIMKGAIFKNKVTQDLFKIKKIEDEEVVVLEDEQGFVQIWLPKEHVGSLFEKIGEV
jgi:hypothetical protein